MKLRSKSIELEQVEHGIAVVGRVQTFRALDSNQVRMIIEVDPEYRNIALRCFDEIGISVALARLAPKAISPDEKGGK